MGGKWWGFMDEIDLDIPSFNFRCLNIEEKLTFSFYFGSYHVISKLISNVLLHYLKILDFGQ